MRNGFFAAEWLVLDLHPGCFRDQRASLRSPGRLELPAFIDRAKPLGYDRVMLMAKRVLRIPFD